MLPMWIFQAVKLVEARGMLELGWVLRLTNPLLRGSLWPEENFLFFGYLLSTKSWVAFAMAAAFWVTMSGTVKMKNLKDSGKTKQLWGSMEIGSNPRLANSNQVLIWKVYIDKILLKVT